MDWAALDKIPKQKVKQQLQQLLNQHQHNFSQGAGLYFKEVRKGQNRGFRRCFTLAQRQRAAAVKSILQQYVHGIANVQLYRSISDLAYTDNLVKFTQSTNMPVCHLDASTKTDVFNILDIDNFADINSILDDSFGDSVLQAVAKGCNTALPTPLWWHA